MSDQPSRTPERRREVNLQYRRRLKLEAFNAYGGPICVDCGEVDATKLSLDHVNGDGADHRQRLTGNSRASCAEWYRAPKQLGWPNDPPLQVLCCACNTRWRSVA